MGCVQVLAVLVVFAALNNVQGHKLCNLEDTKCTTRAVQIAFATLIPGIQDVCEPLDPLHIATMEGELPALKYTLTNLTITGLRDCLYSLAELNPKESSYLSEFICPKLVVQYIYNSKGFIGPVHIDGTGWASVTLNNYKMVIDGYFEKFISENNNKLHIHVVNYNTEFEPKGPVTLDVDGSLHGDPVKNARAADFIQKNGKVMEKLLRATIMPKYVDIIVRAIDNYMRKYPVEDIFYEE